MLEKFSPGAGFVKAMATVRPETLSEDSVGPVCFVFQWWRWAGGAGERERERVCVPWKAAMGHLHVLSWWVPENHILDLSQKVDRIFPTQTML